MIPTHLQERIQRLIDERGFTYAEAWSTLANDPKLRPIFEAMDGKSRTRCNGPAHPGRFSSVEEYNRHFGKASHGGSATLLANLRQNHNQQTTKRDPNMKDPGSVSERTSIIQRWITAALQDDPKLTYQEAFNQAAQDEELAPLFRAMTRAAGASDGVSVGAIRGPDMSRLSLGKQPSPGSRDGDGYPSGFAAGPAINAMRAATGNRISQHPG